MSENLIMCPCCGEMVPEADIELSYLKPDDLVGVDQKEIEDSCKFTSDYYACEEEYFYIRGVIPLPIKDSDQIYNIGAWAQVSPGSFNRIWELWEDENQDKEPRIRGILANKVHLNTGVERTEIQVQLTGPTSRPEFYIDDENCSLYLEQISGITIHRASEYSALCK